VDSSGPDGTFKIGLRPNGKYVVAAGGVSQSSAEKKFETGSGTEHALGDFVVRPANATAEGVVVDEKGDPVAAAEVTPSSVHKYAWRANQTSTDASGRFRLPHLLPDEAFALYVYAPGFEPSYAKNLSPGATDIRVVLKKSKASSE
ncbi:MAG TPA: carboxypeptidase-like regulatory domain-containing protein, partial [Fimbriimonadaceae bacterium]|nr:carboxypeptidase-like regulatory domain-containing protein [Fimbriimonadaceae bacterium]